MPGAFRRDPRATAAVEFVLILPIGLALFIGAVVYADAIATDRKVALTTRAVTDPVTQYPTMSLAEVQALLGAPAQIMAPHSAANVVVTVSQAQVDSGGNAIGYVATGSLTLHDQTYMAPRVGMTTSRRRNEPRRPGEACGRLGRHFRLRARLDQRLAALLKAQDNTLSRGHFSRSSH